MNQAAEHDSSCGYKLRQLVTDQPADADSVLPKLINILSAVEKAHHQGKQHQQLTPDNIRLNEKGHARIPLLLTDSTEKTTYSSSKYAAPEDFESASSTRACKNRDTYVLGFMFYELLLGERLFRTEFAEVSEGGDIGWLHWHADKSKSAKPLSQLIDRFPCGLSDLVGRMLIKDPQLRTADLQMIKRWFVYSRQLTKVEGPPLQAKDNAAAAKRQKKPLMLRGFVPVEVRDAIRLTLAYYRGRLQKAQ